MMYKKNFLILSLFFLASLQSFSGLPEKKIVVIIPSFDNALSYITNLTSVLSQEYDNYHIIYIDDASTDHTGELVAQFIKDNQLENRITFIQNEYNRKALANLYKAAQLCDPTDIILELDGDDALSDTQILSKINELFSTQDVWFAYAQYKNVPEEKAKENKISVLGYTKPTPQSLIESREFRTKWLWSGLRMYYAWLFHHIKLEDLILPQPPYNGKFFPTSKDGACAYPMLEMSGYKIKHIPDIWLLRNIDTPLNDYKIAKDLQMHCGTVLKTSPQYDRLEHPILNHAGNETAKADLLIIADDATTDQLCVSLSSCYKYVTGLANIYLLYHKNAEKYEYISSLFPELIFIQCQKHENVRSILTNYVSNMHDYLIFSKGQHRFKEEVNLIDCINILNSTYAYAFYLKSNLKNFGNPIQKTTLPCEQIIDDIYTWKFNCIPATQIKVHNFDMTLYRTKDVMKKLNDIEIASLGDFERQWKEHTVSMRKIGLFFEQGKVY